MITKYKIFEKDHKYDEYLIKFYEEYERNKNYWYNNEQSYETAKRYNLPIEFHDEFALLKYFYERKKEHEKPIENYIKKRVKEETLKSVLNKMNNDIDLTLQLKELFETSPYIVSRSRVASIINSFFLFQSAIKKTQIFKDIDKFNI